MTEPIHSTGRGGAGNIGPDPTVYTDGEIVREGVMGESTKPEFSTGRGGAGNVVASPHLKPDDENLKDHDKIPQTALREHQENFHIGRGGEGNVHRESHGGHEANKETLGDMVKNLFHHHKDGPEGSS